MRREFFGTVFSAALAVALFAGPVAAVAQSAESYNVSGVTVERSGGSINDARDAAFDEGQRLAFARLMEQLSVPSSRVSLDRVTMDTISGLVAATRVDNETTSAGVYRATLSFDFRPDAVRRFLSDRNATFTEVARQTTVILPVFMSPSGARLWEGDNPWHDALRRLDPASANLPLAVPPGSIEDVSAISVEPALAGDRSRLDAMAERYNAGGVVVAVAEPGSESVTVVLNRFTRDGRDVEVIRVAGNPSDPATYEEAVGRVGAFIRDSWSVETVMQSGPERTLFVRVPLQSADEWFEIQRRLGRVANVSEAKVIRMSPTEIVLEVTYFGSEGQLSQAAGRERLSIERPAVDGFQSGGASDILILRRGG